MNERQVLGSRLEPSGGRFVGGFGLCPRTNANGGFQRKPTFARMLRNDRLWSRTAGSGTPRRGTFLPFHRDLANGDIGQQRSFAICQGATVR